VVIASTDAQPLPPVQRLLITLDTTPDHLSSFGPPKRPALSSMLKADGVARPGHLHLGHHARLASI
jgi:hypothetical protein